MTKILLGTAFFAALLFTGIGDQAGTAPSGTKEVQSCCAAEAQIGDKADCCTKNLACCEKGKTRACCVATARNGCCAKGMKCCETNSACCSAVQECCRQGAKCCDEGKACCGKAVN